MIFKRLPDEWHEDCRDSCLLIIWRAFAVEFVCSHQNSKRRALVTPAKRDQGNKRQEISTTDDDTPEKRHAVMTWAKRLERVFNIDIAICEECGGAIKMIADSSDRSIEDPVVIKQILVHLERKAKSKEFNPLPESRALPQRNLFW